MNLHLESGKWLFQTGYFWEKWDGILLFLNGSGLSNIAAYFFDVFFFTCSLSLSFLLLWL